MDEILEFLIDEADALHGVLYSMTVEEPRRLQAVGLNFQRAAVTFRTRTDSIVAQRTRLCGAGVCEDTEHCYRADVIPQWRALLGTKLARAVAHEDDHGRIDGVRLEFEAEGAKTVDLLLESRSLRVVLA